MHVITSDAVVIGVDTHKDVHVAVAFNGLGARLATASFPVTSKGYRQMAAWAAEHGTVHAFGIEGTGSYYGAAIWMRSFRQSGVLPHLWCKLRDSHANRVSA